MTIDADLVRQLAARREGERLDFKREWYDWAGDGNLELTKDIAAKANLLAPDDPPAYILIGVELEDDQTGKVVGVPQSTNLDSAAYQQKVAPYLNRAPAFDFAPVLVDGLWVGVFEIRPGKRPFYALRDLQKSRPGDPKQRNILRKHEAPIRQGSSTGPASPDEIQEWARRDDPETRAARRLELEAREASLSVLPVLASLDTDHIPTYKDESGEWISSRVFFDLTIDNHGDCKFSIVETRVVWTFTDKFRRDLVESAYSLRGSGKSVAASEEPEPVPTFPDIPPLVQKAKLSPPIMVQPGDVSPTFQISLNQVDIISHVHQPTGIMIASASWVDWVVGLLEIQCRGTSGRVETVSVELVPLSEDFIRERERVKREFLRSQRQP